jgi:O-6-methylguanine DNA methyltransferase
MRCRSALTRMDAARTGELSVPEIDAVHDHLRVCGSCSDSLDDVGNLASRMRGLLHTPPHSCSEDVAAQVADRFDAVEAAGRTAWVAMSAAGVRMIHVGDEVGFRRSHQQRFGRTLVHGKLPEATTSQIAAALGGEPIGRSQLDLSTLTEFERTVLAALATIPRGQVRTYAWLARMAGRPKAIRAVGNVMARNPLPLLMPCHRVVPTSGGIGDYAFGSAMKRDLLRREGVAVDELDDLARRGVRFIGSRTTHIFCCPTCRDARRIRPENRVLLHGEAEALEGGFRPCQHCQPAAA